MIYRDYVEFSDSVNMEYGKIYTSAILGATLHAVPAHIFFNQNIFQTTADHTGQLNLQGEAFSFMTGTVCH